MTVISLGKIPHKHVIRRHDETRRRKDIGNWLYMKVSRTSFYVATFSRRCDNVIYVAMSSQSFHDVRNVKKRPKNVHIQSNIDVLSTSGFDGRRLAEWDSVCVWVSILVICCYFIQTNCSARFVICRNRHMNVLSYC